MTSYDEAWEIVHNNRPNECYCGEDQGAGYTFEDEYGPCKHCEAKMNELMSK